MTPPEQVAHWDALPEYLHPEFHRIALQRTAQHALNRFTLGVLGVVAAVLAGLACFAAVIILGPHYAHITPLVLVGTALVLVGWTPAAQMASSAKYDLLRR